MFDQILRLASAMTSPNPKEKDLLEAMCRTAEEEAKARLPKGMDPSTCGQAFPCAAALLAAANFLSCRMVDRVTGFTAGDIRVSAEGGETAAELLRSRAAEILSTLAGDDRFAFWEVKG